MKPVKSVDPSRQRCMECGHPNREHRADECTVPKCSCTRYVPRETAKR